MDVFYKGGFHESKKISRQDTMQKDKQRPTYRGKHSRTKEQKELNVRFLLFNPENRKLRWSNHRENKSE